MTEPYARGYGKYIHTVLECMTVEGIADQYVLVEAGDYDALKARLEAAERLIRARVEGKQKWTEHEGFCEVELGRQPDGTHGPCDCGFQLLSDMRVWLRAGTPAADPGAQHDQ